MHGVALNIANDINTNKSDTYSPKGVYQNSSIIYSIVFVLSSNSSYMTKQLGIYWVRENVRLYNYCGLVSTVYFVFISFIRKDYLGLYG